MSKLPKVVFRHFRNPQHMGPLDEPDATGRIEGRRAQSQIVVYLKLDAEQRVRLGYELEGDRSAMASLSLLASMVQGWTLPELEALDLTGIADHYGLEPELLPMLVPACEALQATLADLRGAPSPFALDGEVICECLHVRRGALERAIRQRSLRTVEEVRHWTRACAGCRSCRPDVEALLRLANP